MSAVGGSVLADILRRLDRLERQPAAAGEQLQPNYLTLTNGVVGANFTGHVHAQGLDLDAATIATPPDQDRVRWLRQSDGAVIATLSAYSTTVNELLLDARRTLGNSYAAVVASIIDTNGTTVDAQRFIVDSNQASDFLQVTAGPRQLALDFGLSVVNFPNSAIATQQVVTHGLGRAPSMGLANAGSNTSFGAVLSGYCGNFTSTTFTINATSSVSLNFGVGFYWLVIG